MKSNKEAIEQKQRNNAKKDKGNNTDQEEDGIIGKQPPLRKKQATNTVQKKVNAIKRGIHNESKITDEYSKVSYTSQNGDSLVESNHNGPKTWGCTLHIV